LPHPAQNRINEVIRRFGWKYKRKFPRLNQR
jgi:hypothetical protein